MGIKRRKVRRKRKHGFIDTKSPIGIIIDMPLEEFKEQLVIQKVNIGIMNNLILNLEGVYNELRTRKEAVLNLVFEGKNSKDDPVIKKSLDGLYAEMTKVEQKIVYLKDRVKELVDVG